MRLQENTLYESEKLPIIDADCKNHQILVLLKGKGENLVQLNGKTIIPGSTGHSKIRFTKEHFCLSNDKTLSFYTLAGEFVSDCEVGPFIFELMPYRQGVLCSYGDEAVFGNRIGQNRLNYAAPFQQLESCYDIAVQNQLLYDPLFARHKPYACLGFRTESNELLFLDARLKKQKALDAPFDTGNVIAFALTHELGVFLKENQFIVWEFGTAGKVMDYPGSFDYNTRSIFTRHESMFLTVSDYKAQVLKLMASECT